MFKRLFAWMSKYERHISAMAMVVGFVIDQFFFAQVDLLRTQLLFAAYIATCVIAIALLHYIEVRTEKGHAHPRWRSALPIATQFALGGFWSGFVVLYGRSAAFAVSWPFLLLLIGLVILNEVLSKYHSRLIFTNILFFFALLSYAILAVPIYVTQTIGTGTFLLSGLIAIGFFALFQRMLWRLGRARYRGSRRAIFVGSAVVYVLINVFYFTSILPPIPLSLKSVGIYHSVTHVGSTYTASAESESWAVRYGLKDATLHVTPGESLYAYSAVFTPIALTTTITNHWEWYDPSAGKWVTQASIAYPINGGRDGGYRGYSTIAKLPAGKWRVDIETIDGRLIGREDFNLISAQLPPPQSIETLY